jgi:sugar (pentulose or hexulose) kinase
MVGGAMTSTGKALDWFATDVLGGVDTATLIGAAARVQPGAQGLLFLPYLAGERSPIWDPLARGAFVGLTLGHRAPHLARAILEAAALALRHVATPILAAGLRINELRITGGTARHDAWNQIKADVMGVRVAVPEVREAALLGAAIIGAVGLGWHPDTVAAIRSMVRFDHRREPNPANRATYDELFDLYTSLWPAVAPTVHRLGSLGGRSPEGIGR